MAASPALRRRAEPLGVVISLGVVALVGTALSSGSYAIALWLKSETALAPLLNMATAPVLAEKRVALLIGNGAYQNVVALKRPANDARTLAGVLGKLNFSVFLGEDLMHSRDYSDETARVIDEEVEHILRDEEERCRKTLEEYRAGLDSVAQSLLERETLEGEEVARLVDDAMGRKVGGPRMILHADGTEEPEFVRVSSFVPKALLNCTAVLSLLRETAFRP